MFEAVNPEFLIVDNFVVIKLSIISHFSDLYIRV